MAQLRESLRHFSLPTQEWFLSEVGEPTTPQSLSWPCIAEGHSTLLLAPTGSGKTLAAFLAALDRLMFRASEHSPADGVRVLYISPLKALGSDIEKNLRLPISGILQRARARRMEVREPRVGMRTGDTTPRERARLKSRPPDILITTPESLYLMLTSSARHSLRSVEVVIVDEIHALVTTKRGAHLALSLERLERLRPETKLQRIGLSATQTPLHEVASFLGGFSGGEPRPVQVVDAGRSKQLVLSVEVVDPTSSEREPATDYWSLVAPRLLELVRSHVSTMVFVNNRSATERLAGLLNDLAGEELCLSHHGSVSKDRRWEIEARLKSGELKAIVATASLELGIDVGAVDLVLQIEAPPSIASAMQRVGRAGHRVGLASKGVLFPKHRADLLSAAAAVRRMQRGAVEASRYPRNPLDVLAQQVVAICSVERIARTRLLECVRGAAPFADLSEQVFDGVLDMLAGKLPSDDFAELRPRLVWDRRLGQLRARQGAGRIAITSGGTIPDRGLFGVFLEGPTTPVRVGELDEEMVFESRVGDVFVLGASSWRIQAITHDRVLVLPAPGQPGRLPFWHGDGLGRPAEFGRAIGTLARELCSVGEAKAMERLVSEHGLEQRAAQRLLEYLAQQKQATSLVPSDQTIVVERFVDEVGDHRICVLSPLGSRVHAPWALAAELNVRRNTGSEIQAVWYNDGIVFRIPGDAARPATDLLLPDPAELQQLVVEQLSESALFAARFRENAMRALLMPRYKPGVRMPLWAQRKRAAKLLSVAANYPDFPVILETYRECLQDVFDLDELARVLGDVHAGRVEVIEVDSSKPSPFAASLLFAYAGNFVYDRDAPLAERRASVLTLNHAELRRLLGEAELRELLEPSCISELAAVLSGEKHRVVRHADGLADALLAYGDLSLTELEQRATEPAKVSDWVSQLSAEGRALSLAIGGQERWVAVEDAARYRDALGLELPTDLPSAFTQPTERPLVELVSRFARCHVPFSPLSVAQRLGLGQDSVLLALEELERRGRVERGEFLPDGHGTEWCDSEVLRLLKRRSLEALRRQIEPVEQSAYVRLALDWHGVLEKASGLDALLDVVERLEGSALNVVDLEQEILPARLNDWHPRRLDELIGAGEIVWRGLGPLGPRNGRIALYLADNYEWLAPPTTPVAGELAARLRQQLDGRGALFFRDLVQAVEAFPPEVLKVLWQMVWAGEVTNDTLSPLRSLGREDRPPTRRAFRSRRAAPAGSDGRWSLLPTPANNSDHATRSLSLWAETLLRRHAIVTREAVGSELVAGGFSSLLPVLRALEERSRVRRGYFVAGLSGQQFAAPLAADRLRRGSGSHGSVVLAASDPANPYGTLLSWPETGERLQRVTGATVVFSEGRLELYASRGYTQLTTFGAAKLDVVADVLLQRLSQRQPATMLIETIDGVAASDTDLGRALLSRGFARAEKGGIRGLGGA